MYLHFPREYPSERISVLIWWKSHIWQACSSPETAVLDVLQEGNRELTRRKQEVWPHAPNRVHTVHNTTHWHVPVQGERGFWFLPVSKKRRKVPVSTSHMRLG
jgi:hypothetical protein